MFSQFKKLKYNLLFLKLKLLRWSTIDIFFNKSEKGVVKRRYIPVGEQCSVLSRLLLGN